MMSAAGTPSTDPWVVLARERVRYEEQFKSLKPNNGVITGDQAKGFFLQSQLPPLVLGQIWALADTDADGKMDINEFSIACKLINLKLRGFEVPKGIPPSLLASLKVMTPPAVPPLPNAGSMPPSRPAPPKVGPQVPLPPSQPLVGTAQPIMSAAAPPMSTAQPLISAQPAMVPNMGTMSFAGAGISPASVGMAPATGVTPTGIVHPVNMAGVSVGAQNTMIPTGIVQPMAPVQPTMGSIPVANAAVARPAVPPQPVGYGGVGAPLMSTMPTVPGLPPALPSAAPLVSGVTVAPTPLVTAISSTSIGSGPMSPAGSVTGSVSGIPSTVPVAGPGATSTPRASATSLERAPSIDTTMMADWAIPQSTKLKYTQIFNSTDRTRSGFLSGAQARNVMVQTKLPQNTLAQIWALSDMDADGRLGCEEFVLAMHLCEQAALGHPPPAKLTPDLVPPSFRRPTRTASVSSQGSIANIDQDPASTLLQTTFEDKRKENYEKGQAELERRRKQLLDQQKKEAEERERKEREEIERREKARLEAERKRQEEIEKQMREQQEKERLIEEDRKRQLEQKEAARKEMERQRQLEWEKQRLQELQQQRDREQANVLKLKAKNQSLTIELSSLNDQVKDLSQKICDTRIGVSNVKTTIDGMRTTRDSQMAEMSQLKNKLKDQNAKLLAMSQEKAKLEAKNKANLQDSEAKQAYENREINIKNLKEKIADVDVQIKSKESDIENNNSQLDELKNQLNTLISECRNLYAVYEEKRDKVLEMKTSSQGITNFDNAWGTSNDAWGADNGNDAGWPADDKWNDNTAPPDFETMPGVHKYRAIYEFNARNNDEISFQPGDIVYVPEQQTGEPGWLAGEIRGKTGWFPESYCEPVDGVGIGGATGGSVTAPATQVEAEVQATKLEGISEAAEPISITQTVSDVSVAAVTSPPAAQAVQLDGEPEYYIASYPYQSTEPGDLIFNAGEVIAVYKKEGDWWTGKSGDNVGIFPSNYVQKVDVTQPASSATAGDVAPAEAANANVNQGVSAAAVTSALESFSSQAITADLDSEVSAINVKQPDKPFDTTSGVQVMKGKKPEIASVVAPYQATSDGQLSLARGQLIMIRKKTDSGWWEGELQAKGRKRQVGWFPASYVKVLNSSGKISGRTTPVSTSRMQQEIVIDKVVALYPYTAQNPDELTFVKDDIINVTARDEEAWWRGEVNGVSGLFPSNYVAPLQQQSATPTNKKREDAVRELVETEKLYVQDMSIVYEVFELPLRKSRLISTKEIDDIFVNWQEILNCNKSFLNDLNHAWSRKSKTIGDVICRHLPLMTAYITFCAKQLDSAALLQNLTETSTAFRELVRKCQNNAQIKGMPLSSFLIKPMQRITKYPLLIGKILEHTPTDHPDYKFLQEAQRIAERFVNGVNENVRLKENQERMDWLQQHVQNDLDLKFNSSTNKMGPRQLLHFGVLTKVKNNKELLGFLFNDMLMLVQPSKHIGSQFSFQRNSNISYKMYKLPILINHLSISRESTDSVDSGTDWNRVLKLQDDKSGYKINVLAATVHECSSWTKKIELAKEAFEKIDRVNKQNKRKSQLQLGPACGRLLVLVQKGKRLMQSVLSTRKFVVITILEAHEVLVKCTAQTCSFNKRRGKPHNEQVYCKVTLGNQEQITDYAKDTLTNGNLPNNNGLPQIPALVWNSSMQFQLRNINEEMLSFVVLEHNPYSVDEFLGKADLKLADIYKESQNTNGPLIKKLVLHQVSSGEITVKLDLHMFDHF